MQSAPAFARLSGARSPQAGMRNVRALVLVLIISAAAYGQTSTPDPELPKVVSNLGVVLIGLSQPTYPPLARQARITGEVELQLQIRKDGSVESVRVVKGHPLLAPATVESARRSHFECRECNAEVSPYSLTYSFQLTQHLIPPCADNPPLLVLRLDRYVIVDAAAELVQPNFSYVTARSAKCLYLWRCSRQWGGEDYYFQRGPAAKCLYLWNCGHKLREPWDACKRLREKS